MSVEPKWVRLYGPNDPARRVGTVVRHYFTGVTADHSVPVAASCACGWEGEDRDNWLLAVEDYADHKAQLGRADA